MKKQKNNFSICIAISIFLFLKFFQLLNSFVLVEIFFSGEGFPMLIGMVTFVIAIALAGLLAQKFLPAALDYIFLIMFSVLMVAFFVNIFWLLVLLAGLFWYAVISAEAQVLRALAEFKQVPRYLPVFFGAIFLFVAYRIPQQTHSIVAQAFFMGSSILALIVSYSPKTNGKTVSSKKAPPFLIGLIFILGSAFSYFSGSYNEPEVIVPHLLAFSLVLYLIGGLIINLSLDGYVRKNS